MRRVLRGYHRGKAVPNRRQPVSFDMLGGLLGSLDRVCTSAHEAALFRTAFILAFFGALQVGELVCKSKRGGEGLDVGNVVLRDGVVSIFHWQVKD